MNAKRIVIGVIGSGTESHAALSEPLGRWLAGQDCDLINGGGGGVMAEVSRAFTETPHRKGKVIGILPASGPCDSPEARSATTPAVGYPNPWIDIAIHTHLHLSGTSGKEMGSRNAIILLTADAIVAFPGGAGTRSEIQLALEYGKPLLILSPHQEWDEFKESRATLATTIDEAILWLTNTIFKDG